MYNRLKIVLPLAFYRPFAFQSLTMQGLYMEFVKVFDLAETGYRTWKFAAFGLIFMGVGTVLLPVPLVNGISSRGYRS